MQNSQRRRAQRRAAAQPKRAAQTAMIPYVPGRLPNNKGVVRAPAAQNQSSRQTGRDSIRYRERERIATVPGSVSFGIVNNIPCNPGLATSFPWLSGHANLYDKYRVHGITYRYKNLKGTSSAGNILMMFDYDTLDPAPTSAIQFTQSTVWQDGAPWRLFEMKVPSKQHPLYTRNGNIAGADLKTYDLGRLYVAAEGCADTSDHGYIEVEYDIELFHKQHSIAAPVPLVAEFNLASDASASGTTVTIPFGEELLNNLGITNTSGQFTLPAGNYRVDVEAGSNTSYLSKIELQVDAAATTPPTEAYFGGVSATNMQLVLSKFLTLAVPAVINILATGSATSNVDKDATSIKFTCL